jgi:hypothetical protein
MSKAMSVATAIDIARIDPCHAVQGGVCLLTRPLEKALNEGIDEKHLRHTLARLRQPIVRGVDDILAALERGDDPMQIREMLYACTPVYRASERARLFDQAGRLVVDTATAPEGTGRIPQAGALHSC